MAEAGWYPDQRNPGSELYWDGQSWTGQRRPAGGGGGAPVPQRRGGGSHRAGGGQVPAQPAQETRVNPVFRDRPQQPAAPQGGPPAQQSGQGAAGQGDTTRIERPAPGPYGAAPWQQGGAPAYGAQQGYVGQGYAQGYGRAPGHGPGGPGAPGGPGGAAPRRGRRKPLVIGGVAIVLLLAAGLVTWLVWPSSSPSLTYNGKTISNASGVLSGAETSLDSTVKSRHGVESSDTRCYYAKSANPPKGTTKSDVQNTLYCGPVLFVDGSTSAEYLKVPITSTGTSGGNATLSAQKDISTLQPVAVGGDVVLTRPDGKKPPAGNGGLSVPKPPPAAKNSLVATSLGSTPAPGKPAQAVMEGSSRKVTLVAAGEISRYGRGDDARSAPPGQKLLAFQLQYGFGALSTDTSGALVKLVVDGTARDIPQASGDQYDVAAVPSSSTVAVQLTDHGVTQTLALPGGQPGPNNLLVLARTHRTALIGQTFDVPIRLTRGSQTVNATFHASASLASLDYWPPANTALHPSAPDKGFLTVRVNYTTTDEPGKTFGFDPGILTLKLASGAVLHARNIAPNGKISNVFEVPADFTSGTVSISGSEQVSGGITLTVRSAKSFPVTLQAG